MSIVGFIVRTPLGVDEAPQSCLALFTGSVAFGSVAVA